MGFQKEEVAHLQQLRPTEQSYLRLARTRICFGVPQFETLYEAISLEGNRTRMAAGADYVAHMQGFDFAVAIVDHDMVKLNRGTAYTQLQKVKASIGASYFNVIVIVPAVDVCYTQINPIAYLGRGHAAKHCYCEKTNECPLH